MSNIIAIVGRPNVGKSTLFNRLIGQRKAIMDNVSGVTRDRHYGFGEWCGKPFTVIDTGGYVHNSDDIFEEEIRKQVLIAMNEADVILFMVDLMEGIHDLDREFANYVRRTKKPVLVVANKADTPLRTNLTGEFYALGVGKEIYAVSSQTGSGTGELLDEVVTHFKEEKEEKEEDPDHIPRIAIVGRPNVGKSSLLNVLLSAERSIVTDIAGTTRDSIDTSYNAFGMNLILTDTAGLRKKTVEKEDIEFYSGLRTINALENCDVCICMVDAERGVESQDVNIISLAAKNKKAIVVVVNKWDLVEEKDSNVTKEWDKFIKSKLAPMDYFPIIYTSVETKQRIHKVLEKAIEVYHNKKKKIPTSQLNEIMLREIDSYPPPSNGGRYVKIKYITQLPTKNPTFAFFCSNPKYIKEPYTRYLENKMRLHFGFDGVPITLIFKQK